MLFSSNNFMREILRRHPSIICTIFIFNIIVSISAEGQKIAKFSSDFQNFLNDLGSIVYKSKKVIKNDHTLRQSTTVLPTKYWKKENIRNTQKEILGDMLMMKLVSYYEDKYKLSYDKEPNQQMTEKITPMHLNRFNEIERPDMRPSSYNRNRRFNGPSSRRTFEEPLPNVVVL